MEKKFDNEDKDLSFWAASLIVHYGLDHPKAKKIMTDAILSGPLDKAYIAATLLCRMKYPYAKPAILQRLKDTTLTKEGRVFLRKNCVS